ncbi:phytoene desaturase family protein [Arthrobacter sp. FW306-07-I]|uniref:phytoene desaturase family protein n=1 Tax=Arthrobacter sp. FW306-07-I TaxID=2879622 RepID=UPI001F2D3D73|nr:NAD(P)/FAD-dependent oxidoreductase [Arthrobacter sp. FW306-07-I]UKA77138.1 NAD(P)/FAD-dependent oxidoreductase [Arthrobacter sp. FW306-07-I]
MKPDAVVVGAGPNGLAAAVTLARAGLKVQLIEGAAKIGGGTRTAELTLPGFRHDVCSAVHPMALASPFFQAFELEKRIELRVPEISYAHTVDAATAGIAFRSLTRTAEGLGPDGDRYRRLFQPLVERVDGITDLTMHQLLRIPRDRLGALLYAARTLEQGGPWWNTRFKGDIAPAMVTGVSAHCIGSLPGLATSGTAMLLGAHAHARGWPLPVGGSQSIADAMAEDLLNHGGEIVLDSPITGLAEVRNGCRPKAILLDLSAAGLAQVAGAELPTNYLRKLGSFRYGNAVSKVDFALSGPIPWANPALAAAPTVHLGGTRAEMSRAEAEVASGGHPRQPFVLACQPSTLDSTRAPSGDHILWTYTHVPAGSTLDTTETITRRVEQFAPGFRDVILATHSITAHQYSQYNPNYVGGDFSAGALSARQLLKRPVISSNPWRTPAEGIYLCSSSTPPGPSVHGLCGWYAAQSALKGEFGLPSPELSYRTLPAGNHAPGDWGR